MYTIDSFKSELGGFFQEDFKKFTIDGDILRVTIDISTLKYVMKIMEVDTKLTYPEAIKYILGKPESYAKLNLEYDLSTVTFDIYKVRWE